MRGGAEILFASGDGFAFRAGALAFGLAVFETGAAERGFVDVVRVEITGGEVMTSFGRTTAAVARTVRGAGAGVLCPDDEELADELCVLADAREAEP